MSGPLPLLDFAEGQRFALGPVTVTAEAIKDFAREFDPQLFHLDEVAAAESVLHGLSASGFHTGALLIGMIEDSLRPAFDLARLASLAHLNWLRPVYAGDVLSGMVAVAEEEDGVLRFSASVQDQQGVAKAQVAGSLLLRKPMP